ncbi:MAG: TlyA family RNA methyltransferase [Burkholderiaceae bacterium]|nr:TlyA family RNA methyltransferase [Burkholderiaceae bacterium]
MRADQLLVHRGLASTRAQAQRLIASGVQWLKLGHHHTAQGALDSAEIGTGSARSTLYWQRVVKNGDILPDDAQIELLDTAEARYVSRGGLKLEGALQTLGLSVAGSTCLDVGQSTGGFTDCLLQLGAARVVGVDVGFGQLHDKLRSDERVLCFERVNAREPGAIAAEIAKLLAGEDDIDIDSEFDEDDDHAEDVEFTPKTIAPKSTNTLSSDLFEPDFIAEFDFIVGDLSFISQTLVLPALAPLLKPGGCLVMLVKPQFELNFGQVGKGGIVREAALYAQVEKRLREAYAELGLTVHAWLESPIQGGDGNREFFIHASKVASF